jgi:hypothetical protein
VHNPSLQEAKQIELKFEANLSYIERPYLKKKKPIYKSHIITLQSKHLSKQEYWFFQKCLDKELCLKKKKFYQCCFIAVKYKKKRKTFSFPFYRFLVWMNSQLEE